MMKNKIWVLQIFTMEEDGFYYFKTKRGALKFIKEEFPMPMKLNDYEYSLEQEPLYD